MRTNADEILFRCSGLGNIMQQTGLTDIQKARIAELGSKEKLTDKQALELGKLIYKKDNPELSDGCKTHLIDLFTSWQYGRREDIQNKYLDKGNEREQDAITLLSLIKKRMFKKNDQRLKNNFIQGEPDIFIGESINNADETFDTKCSWSANTFFRAKFGKANSDYVYQGHGYMWLTGAKIHTIAYCLVNGTEKAIIDEKRRLSFQMSLIDESQSEEYKKRCRQIEINHIFNIKSFLKENPHFEFDNDVDKWKWDIPMNERLFAYSFERDQTIINAIEKRAVECRKWIDKYLFEVIPEQIDIEQEA